MAVADFIRFPAVVAQLPQGLILLNAFQFTMVEPLVHFLSDHEL